MISMYKIWLVLSGPLLWWLLSVAIAIWAVLVVQVDNRPGRFDRMFILLLLFVSASFGGDLFVSMQVYAMVAVEQIFSVQDVLQGEKSSIGAIVASTLVVLAYLRIRKIPVLTYADNIVPYVALAYVAARIGCFINGDDFGIVTGLPWGVVFGADTQAYEAHLARGWIDAAATSSLKVHPTQLYHALAGIAGFILLRRWRPGWQGSRFALAWLYYGGTRFFIQFYRDDHWAAGHVIDRTQWFCLLFVLLSLALWRWHATLAFNERAFATGYEATHKT